MTLFFLHEREGRVDLCAGRIFFGCVLIFPKRELDPNDRIELTNWCQTEIPFRLYRS